MILYFQENDETALKFQTATTFFSCSHPTPFKFIKINPFSLETTKLSLHIMDCGITQKTEIPRPLFQDRLLLTAIRSSFSYYLCLSSGSRGHTDGQIDRQTDKWASRR